jgi:hypothetical protein
VQLFVGVLLWAFVVAPMGLLIAYAFGCYTLAPLRQEGWWLKNPTQFRITDIYLFVIQLFLAGYSLSATGREPEQAWPVTAVVWAFLGWCWWLGVRMLTRAEEIGRAHV